jgi:tetratricopeptide (TPR) repeat protein
MNCFTTCGTLLNEYLQAGAYDKLQAFAGRINMPYFWSTSFGRTWALMKMALGYRKLREKKYQDALADFEAAGRVPETLEKNYLEAEPVKARRLFYTGYCRSKLGNAAGAAEAWTAALDIQRHIRFEASYSFTQMQARYYQAFCLRGLGRPREADAYIQSIKEFDASSGMANASAEGKRHLLDLAYLGLETNLDNFDRFDRELGITSFATMTTSVEK